MLKYYLIFTLITLSSCGYFFGKNNKIEFTCNINKNISLKPPKGTFKCTISVNQICNVHDTLVLYSKGKKLQEFEINHLGNIYQSDWYENELGLSYLPNKNSNESGSIILSVKFFH